MSFQVDSPRYPAKLSLNERLTWQARHDRFQKDKRIFGNLVEETILANPGIRLPLDPCILFITYAQPKGIRDLDNMDTALKGWIDALVDLGVIKDDSWKHLKTKVSTTSPHLPPGVKVRIRVEQIDG